MDLKKLLGIALLFYFPQCLCMESKDDVELREVKVVVDDDSNTKEIWMPSVKMPVSEKRRSVSLNEMDGSPHSPRNVSPRSLILLHQKRRSVSEADLFNIDPEELAEKIAYFTVGAASPTFQDVKQICSEGIAKMSPKNTQTSPLPAKRNRLSRPIVITEEESEPREVSAVDYKYLKSFKQIATSEENEIDKRSSAAINVANWMLVQAVERGKLALEREKLAVENERLAIEAERDTAREKEKTARMKNFYGLLAALFGGATTITGAVLAYLASTYAGEPCEVCEVCQNIVNGTMNL